MRNSLGFVILAFWLGASVGAVAQTFPNGPVKLICDSAAGSANDVTARLYADKMSQIWKQPVVVVDTPGAGGAIAARQAAAAAPDGYTIFMPVTSEFYALAGAPDVAANLPLRLEGDFKSVAFANAQPLFIGASLKARFDNVAQMLALAKKDPGGISYGTSGKGRLTHLAMELLQSMTDTKLQMVAYTTGVAQAMSELNAGRVEMALEAYAGLAPMFKGGLLKGLATTNPTRSKAFPEIPALSETVPGYGLVAWGVFVAPLGTPDAIIQKMNADFRIAQEAPDVTAALAANAGETRYMTPAEITAFVTSEQQKILPVLEKAMRE